MSGGSYQYAYRTVEDFAEKLTRYSTSSYRKAFGKHLFLIAKAMHDIEWCESGDMSEPADKDAIMKCIDKQDVLQACIQDADKIMNELRNTIAEAKDAIQI